MKLFEPVIGDLHPSFQELKGAPRFEAARQVMQQVADGMTDPDGNFVREFQGRGFDQRVWELYLFATLSDLQLSPVRLERPDFDCLWRAKKFFVEATTTGRRQDTSDWIERVPRTAVDFYRELSSAGEDEAQYLQRRLLRALRQKIRKHYELDAQVKGRPIAMAIAHFCSVSALFHPNSHVSTCLYGVSVAKPKFDGTSGLFAEAEARNVAAVLFSNSGTVNKFTRLGVIQGLNRSGHQFVHWGYQYNHEEGAQAAKTFQYNVGGRKEKWSEGLSVFHNPIAINPLPFEAFSGCLQMFVNRIGDVVGFGPEFQPFNSATELSDTRSRLQ